MSARCDALAVLCLTDPVAKAAQTRALYAGLDDGAIDPHTRLEAPGELPGRPLLPRLRHAKEIPTRTPFTPEGKAAMLHAVTHIEFNAIKNMLLVSISYRDIKHRRLPDTAQAMAWRMSNVKLAVAGVPEIPSNPG